MSHTPAQAKALWCPMVRASSGSDSPCNAGNGPDFRKPSYARCIADQCAAWRWVPTTASVPVHNDGFTTFEIKATQTHGFCGLAGRSA